MSYLSISSVCPTIEDYLFQAGMGWLNFFAVTRDDPQGGGSLGLFC